MCSCQLRCQVIGMTAHKQPGTQAVFKPHMEKIHIFVQFYYRELLVIRHTTGLTNNVQYTERIEYLTFSLTDPSQTESACSAEVQSLQGWSGCLLTGQNTWSCATARTLHTYLVLTDQASVSSPAYSMNTLYPSH